MNDLKPSRIGRALYEALPEVYRTRDGQEKGNGQGHLAAYLDSCGTLLDAIYNSLDQRYKDCFPETCQEWLLPYFAELVGAFTLSPQLEGRRKEIMHAIAWRQSKGTLKTVDQIAKEIGEFEHLFVQEGWKRVARTVRADGPSSLPTIVNLRGKTPQNFVGHRNTDVCSVDVRKPDWRQGHANPRTVLFYASPYAGFFTDKNVIEFQWNTAGVNGTEDVNTWFTEVSEPPQPSEYIELKFIKETNTWSFFKKPEKTGIINITAPSTKNCVKTLEGAGLLNPPLNYHFSEINLEGAIKVTEKTRLVLEKLAARDVQITGQYDEKNPSFIATDCLIQTLSARNRFVRLVYCTVFDKAIIEHIEASDCIFAGGMLYDSTWEKNPSKGNGIRYSRHGQESRFGRLVGNTTDMPVFYTKEWGKPGCGVIHPATPKSICNGAEDGGEMGAFHHRAYVLAWEAVSRKLLDYLPVGMNAALIPDKTLAEND